MAVQAINIAMNNITGIVSSPYIDLQNHIDLKSYDMLHSEICLGFSKASHLTINGSQIINEGSINPGKFKPLYEAYKELQSLPDSNPLKQAAQGLDYNQLTTYLKYAFGGYDLYARHVLFENCTEEIILGEVAEYFPNVIKWILNLKDIGVFSNIDGATFFLLEAGGVPYEHCDPAPSPESVSRVPEFVHIKTDLDRPFYLIDPASKEKTYITTRAAWWNERDWHGGEPILKPTYTFRVDGTFTKEFKDKILKNA
jgi:hypothetical protein